MQLLYNSDSFTVMAFEFATAAPTADVDAAATTTRGGFEIVDKFAHKDVFLDGAIAETFKAGVQALVEKHPGQPSEEELDEYIGRFTVLMQQPLVMH